MRSTVLVFLILSICPALGFQNEPKGFRGIVWGTSITKLGAEMKVVETDSDLVFYSRAGDRLLIGGAQREAIVYGFYKGQFSTVGIDASEAQKDALHDAIEAQFGPAPKLEYKDFWAWEGATTTITLDCNAIRCNAIIFSATFEKQKKADEAKAAKKASKDF